MNPSVQKSNNHSIPVFFSTGNTVGCLFVA